MNSRKHKGEYKIECSRCGKELEDHRKGKQRYCLKCNAETSKKYRKGMELNTHLNILHLPERTDRLEHLMKELEAQGIAEFSVFSGFRDLAAVFRGISNSHKRIVMMAKAKKMPNVIIAEDDIKFTSKGAWKYFLEQLELNKDADMFLSMVYEGIVDENNRLVKNPYSFSGMTMYNVNSKFYDVFLNVNPMNHIDKALGVICDQYDFRVCNPMTTVQLNGYSDNKKKECKYDHLLKGRKLFGVNS